MFDEAFVIFFGIVAIVFTLFFFGLSWAIGYDCTKFQEATGRQTKVVGLECYAMTNDGWIPSKQIRNTQ